jgi:hypothetical protein
MEIIFIGDIHGLTIWEKIVENHPTADHFVFVGDYLDSFTISGLDQLQNLQNIITYKIENPTKVTLLLGNHDYHYWPSVLENLGTTSGFQSKMYHVYKDLFNLHKDLFKMCVILDNYLITHAGVSDLFLETNGFYQYDSIDVAEFINELFFYKPLRFDFKAIYDIVSYVDDYGDNVGQSPIWIRPLSLQRGNRKSFLKKSYIQIVGHTQRPKLLLNGKTTGGKYVYIDTLPNNQYLISEDGVLRVGFIH